MTKPVSFLRLFAFSEWFAIFLPHLPGGKKWTVDTCHPELEGTGNDRAGLGGKIRATESFTKYPT